MLKDVQEFDGSKLRLKKIYVCMDAKCDAVLSVDENQGFPTRRQPCGHFYEKEKGSCYVFVLPIEKQLINLLENADIGLKDKGIKWLNI